eukprot:CAMPEP_0170360400 /NCGR_PEP_ID=MMETSP0117_2-20130122/3260_1 /TAXON_ID=400756 /ORGANISM="Durinskia baltica, Strain CSIRO CS-38" /LENGTH=83 /DNA_ID=CAMNT_0010614711 /DNA_START=245 /DNA_END=493 /DNA_ORIENTATION=-
MVKGCLPSQSFDPQDLRRQLKQGCGEVATVYVGERKPEAAEGSVFQGDPPGLLAILQALSRGAGHVHDLEVLLEQLRVVEEFW